MPAKKHRLFTRWFSRKIDLGVLLSGGLFILIWSFLPSPPLESVRAAELGTIHVQTTTVALSDILPHVRPDLIHVPSRYTFTPVWELPDTLAEIPYFPYATTLTLALSEPAGMGRLSALTAGSRRNGQRGLVLPLSVARESDVEISHMRVSDLQVGTSAGLGATRLRTAAAAWAEELEGEDPWRFSFWISFSERGEPASVFVEERSGDIERDLRLVRIVERPDLWENPSGMGIVRLQFAPTSGAEHEN